jgi:hypothetical protein
MRLQLPGLRLIGPAFRCYLISKKKRKEKHATSYGNFETSISSK